MCGIAGILHFEGRTASREILGRMGESLRHRGPEAEGFYLKNGTGFIHRRLKIIDLETGDQPIFNHERSVLALLNGEIYNYQAIRERLVKKGVQFSTQSDTEVLIHLYEECGDLSFLEELNGMFAFVLHDIQKNITWIARDRTGEKPLYYHSSPRLFAFASEIQALMQLSDISREPDFVAIDSFFHYGYIPAPLSIYGSVRKLEPGTFLTIQNGACTSHRYWEIPFPSPQAMSMDEAYERFKFLLSDAVRLRMVADVPVGAFLSGGVDSSTVTALMRPHSNHKIRTFTIGFASGSYDESESSVEIAAKLGTEHSIHRVAAFRAEEVPEILKYFGEPFADSSSIPVYYLCRSARQGIKVALSGDGADEILGGYNRYVAAQMGAPYLRIPRLLRPDFLLEAIRLLPESHAYYGTSSIKKLRMLARFLAEVSRDGLNVAPFIFGDDARRSLYSQEFRARITAAHAQDPVREIARRYQELDLTTRMLWTDFSTYLPDDIHVKVDRMSMAHALEVRTPFMDHRLIEFLAQVPLQFKINGFETKILLRRLMAEFLPGHHRKAKHGFEAPIAHWIQLELREQIHRLFSSEIAGRYFDRKVLGGLLKRHTPGREDLSGKIWPVYTFLLWAESNL